MKRFLSMVLTFALVFTTLVIPAAANGETAADTVAVDITSISDGATYKAGQVIRLEAKAPELADVKAIDFYANGSKLPGTIVGNSGSINWYAPAEGTYTITTKVTNASSGVTTNGSESVTIAVVPADTSRMTLLWPDGQDLDIKTDEDTIYEYTDEYAIFGESLKIIPKSDVYARFNRTPKIARTWERMLFLVYSPGEAPQGVTVARYNKETGQYTGAKMMDNQYTVSIYSENDSAIENGLNVYTTGTCAYVGGAAGEAAGNKATHLDYASVYMTAPTDENPEDKPVYILGIYGMANGQALTPVATPEIGDNAQNVCNELGTYRINFSCPIFPDETKKPAVVKTGGEEVQGVTYSYGTNYVDLHLPTLTTDTTYTVTLAEDTILSYYTFGYKEAKTENVFATATYSNGNEGFTFTTKGDLCGSATPIVKMSYPANGATAAVDTGFAAQIVAPNSTIKSAKFFAGDAEIPGTVTKMADGEWWIKPDTAVLTAGETTTVTVKFYQEDGATEVASASATYTGAAQQSYYVKGIYDGANVVIGAEPSKTITVVDADQENYITTKASNVARVDFFKDGVLVGTDFDAPYQYELVSDTVGENLTFEARIYDVYGGVYPKTFTYDVLAGNKHTTASYEVDFENMTLDEAMAAMGISNRARCSFALETSGTNTRMKLAPDGEETGNNYFNAFPGVAASTGSKVHVYEFDFATKVGYAQYVYLTDGTLDTTLIFVHPNTDITAGTDMFTSFNTTRSMRFVLDFNDSPVAIAYIKSGEKWIEWKKVALTGFDTTKAPKLKFGISNKAKEYPMYIDNVEYSAYGTTTVTDYAIKGIYDGKTFIAQEEPSAVITVVDKANENYITTTATDIEKVELYNNGQLVATDTDAADGFKCEYKFGNYGNNHNLEVKVYGVYGDVYTKDFDYNVVNGIKNETLSISENFEGENVDYTAIVEGHNYGAFEIATLSGSKSLKISNSTTGTATEKSGSVRFKTPVPEDADHQNVYYLEFDYTTKNSYTSKFSSGDADAYRDELFTTHHNAMMITKDTNLTQGSNVTRKMGIVLDYTARKATLFVDGKEWKQIALTNLSEGCEVPRFGISSLHGKAPEIYIDNYSYTVYNVDATAKFGTAVYAREYDVVGDSVAITTGATNTSGVDGSLINIIAVYDSSDRLLAVKEFDAIDYANGDFKTQTYNVPITEEGAAKVRVFTLNDDGTIAPVGLYK